MTNDKALQLGMHDGEVGNQSAAHFVPMPARSHYLAGYEFGQNWRKAQDRNKAER